MHFCPLRVTVHIFFRWKSATTSQQKIKILLWKPLSPHSHSAAPQTEGQVCIHSSSFLQSPLILMKHWKAEQSREQAGNGPRIAQMKFVTGMKVGATPNPPVRSRYAFRSEVRGGRKSFMFLYQSWKTVRPTLCFFRPPPGWLAAKTAPSAQSHPLSFREALTSSFHHFTFNRKNLKGNIISCTFCCSSLTTLLHEPQSHQTMSL